MIANPLCLAPSRPPSQQCISFLSSKFGKTALKIAAVCLALVIAAAIVAIPPVGVPLGTLALACLSSSVGGLAGLAMLFSSLYCKKQYDRKVERANPSSLGWGVFSTENLQVMIAEARRNKAV